jgi:hypothetical protein
VSVPRRNTFGADCANTVREPPTAAPPSSDMNSRRRMNVSRNPASSSGKLAFLRRRGERETLTIVSETD